MKEREKKQKEAWKEKEDAERVMSSDPENGEKKGYNPI